MDNQTDRTGAQSQGGNGSKPRPATDREVSVPSISFSDIDEQLLAIRACAGNTVDSRAAYGELATKCRPALVSAAFHVLRDADAAEDAAQEALIRGMESLSTFEHRSKISTWLVSIVVNHCLDRLRSLELRTTMKIVASEEVLETLVGLVDVGTVNVDSEIFDVVDHALERLPENHADAFRLRYFAGLEYRQIADTLRVEIEIARVWVSRARESLRDLVKVDPSTKRIYVEG